MPVMIPMPHSDVPSAGGCACGPRAAQRCLVDDVLRIMAKRSPGEGAARTLCESIEIALRRHVPVQWVRFRAVRGSVPTGALASAASDTTVRVPIPARAGGPAWVLEVGLPVGHPLSAAAHQLVRRAAVLWELATEFDRRGGVAVGPFHGQGRVRDGAAPLIGSSAPMRALRERIERVASSDFTILIEGESGTGKELVARQIHDLSPRRRGPFVAVNCAALVDSLLEAELFGIEDRTATGVRGRRGKFEHASGGTLFLDEVADLSPSAQAKLLRAIQECAVERVGGHTTCRVDIRMVVASNRSLRDLVSQGGFRADLYYRLSGVELKVPPLRTRREDIIELAQYFLGRHAGARQLGLSSAVSDALVTYVWPGNVRELERLIEAVVVLAQGDQVELGDLPIAVKGPYAEVLEPSVADGESLRAWGTRYVRLVLHRCGYNKREACRILDISYHTLQTYLRGDPAFPEMEREVSEARSWPTTSMKPVEPHESAAAEA